MAKILQFDKSVHYDAVSKSYLVHLDGKSMPTLELFYQAMSEALQFPDYFAHNLDSFDEIINDLEWIEAEHILLLISRSHLWLKQHEEAKQNILDIFTEADMPHLELWLI